MLSGQLFLSWPSCHIQDFVHLLSLAPSLWNVKSSGHKWFIRKIYVLTVTLVIDYSKHFLSLGPGFWLPSAQDFFFLFLKILLPMKKSYFLELKIVEVMFVFFLKLVLFRWINALFQHVYIHMYISLSTICSVWMLLVCFLGWPFGTGWPIGVFFLGLDYFSHSQYSLVASSFLCRVEDSSLAFLLSMLSSQVGETYGCSFWHYKETKISQQTPWFSGSIFLSPLQETHLELRCGSCFVDLLGLNSTTLCFD